MAKVLKEAKDNPSLWRKEYTCTGRGWEQLGTTPCGRLIEVLATDIQSRKHKDWDGSMDTYYGFTCPACGSFNEIPFSDMTPEVRSMATNNRY